MKCLNTRGCNNEATEIKEIGCSNFCSYECFLICNDKRNEPVSQRKTFEDTKRQELHDLYIYARSGIEPDWVKRKEPHPPASEWIVTLKDGNTYLWDDFKGDYVRYILGKGIVEFKKQKGNYIVTKNEQSAYYNAVINRINEVQSNPELLFKKSDFKLKLKRGVKKGEKRGPYKTNNKKNKDRQEYKKICPRCLRKFTTFNVRQTYCRNACKQYAYRKRKTKREIRRKNAIVNTI